MNTAVYNVTVCWSIKIPLQWNQRGQTMKAPEQKYIQLVSKYFWPYKDVTTACVSVCFYMCRSNYIVLSLLMCVSQVTDGVVDVIVYPSSTDKSRNRGFAFVEYESHKAAAMARRKLIPGTL